MGSPRKIIKESPEPKKTIKRSYKPKIDEHLMDRPLKNDPKLIAFKSTIKKES